MGSINILFDILKTHGLTEGRFLKRISSLSESKLIDIIDSLADIDFENGFSVKKDSSFNFVANTTLSGGPFPCSEYPCRFNNIDNLARNAILYADTVFITNPFEKYGHYLNFGEYERYEFTIDLALLYYIRPLLEEGIFRICKSNHHVCRNCLKEINALTKSFEKKIDRIEDKLYDIVLNDFVFKVRRSDKSLLSIEVKGPSDIIEHPLVFRLSDEKSIALKKTLKIGQKLPKEIILDLNLHYLFVHQIADDLLTQNYYSNVFKSYYLTNRLIDVQLIAENQSEKKKLSNQNIQQNTGHYLPFVIGSDFKRLIKLRKDEGEAFQTYRSSITSLLVNADKPNYDLSQAFKEEIEPEIFKMDQTIKTNKKLIYSDIKKDLLVGTTFVSIGLFSNIVPANVAQIIAGLGGINYAGKFGDNFKKLVNIETDIRSNKYFFVWKLKNKRLLG
jgi:hypothetical protein